MSPLDKAWRIIEVLEGEARDYLFNKLESERDDPEKVFTLLTRRFGTGCNSMQIRRFFAQRDQRADEDVMQYLDALEHLRNQGHPRESHTDRRYEILQRFIEGVRNQNLRESLSAMYAHEDYLDYPPTVEEVRFATQQYLRTRGSYREKAPFGQQNQNRQPQAPQISQR